MEKQEENVIMRRSKMKKIIGVLIGMTLLVGIAGCGNTGDEDEGKDVISMGVTPYPQIDAITAILEVGYQELGYETEHVEGDVGFMYLGVSQGDIDIYPDGWLPILHSNYIERYGDKLDVGEVLYEQASMGITVPAYMTDINTIEDLKENADLFDNRIVGIEPSAGIMLTATKTIDAYDMGGSIEILESSTPAMLAEVDTAIREEAPIAFLGWRPHIMFSKYDLKILEDSQGIWEADDVLTVTTPKLKERAPDAYEFSQRFQMTVDDLEDILAQSDETGVAIEDVAVEWFQNNREVLDEMLEQKDGA